MIRLMRLWEETQPAPNVICAWCKKGIEYNPKLPTGTVSHGMCAQCQKNLGIEDDA